MSFDSGVDDEVHVLGTGWVSRDDMHYTADDVCLSGSGHVPGVDLPDVDRPHTITRYLVGVLRFLSAREM